MAKIRLGHRYKEVISGIEGTAMSLARHLTGCDRVTLRVRTREGLEDTLTYDTTRLRLVPKSKVTEHKPIKIKVKMGDIYQDRTTSIIGHVTATLERVGLPHALVTLEYKDPRTGMPVYAHVDEPLLDKVQPAKPETKAVKKAGQKPGDNGPGPDICMTGMPVAQGHATAGF